MVSQALRQRRMEDYWGWFYTPTVITFAEALEADLLVDVCVDQVSLIKGVPSQLHEQENALFKTADIVYNSSRNLYNAKRARCSNDQFFSKSVDALHFRPGAADHPLQTNLPHPRSNYCGVIDERIDIGLIAVIASMRADWQMIMVEPSAKIDTADLPRRKNIRWLGQRSYAGLLTFITGRDVYLLPFALNDAIRFTSPTKTLKYMACGKPCVSTAIRGVVKPFSPVVPKYPNVAGFGEACCDITVRTAIQTHAHRAEFDDVVRNVSWNATPAEICELIAELQVVHKPHSTLHMLATTTAPDLRCALSSALTAASRSVSSRDQRFDLLQLVIPACCHCSEGKSMPMNVYKTSRCLPFNTAEELQNLHRSVADWASLSSSPMSRLVK